MASSGRKTSCPAALAAVSNPMANPFRFANQRFATAAAMPIAPAPEPMPTISPQVRYNCQGAVMKFDSPVPAISITMHPRMVRFRPTTSMSPVRNGPVAPSRMMLSETAPEIVATSQPNARCNGTIMTPGAARTPTPASVAENITVSTIQA
jgi:hypothetical protein